MASNSLRSIGVPSRKVYAITANGGMNNNPSIRINTVHEIEIYKKIIILKKTATFNFIVLFIITGRSTSLYHKNYINCIFSQNDHIRGICWQNKQQTIYCDKVDGYMVG